MHFPYWFPIEICTFMQTNAFLSFMIFMIFMLFMILWSFMILRFYAFYASNTFYDHLCFLWLFMNMYDHSWWSMIIYDHLWFLMVSYDFYALCKICYYAFHMISYVFLWFLMFSYDFLWFLMFPYAKKANPNMRGGACYRIVKRRKLINLNDLFVSRHKGMITQKQIKWREAQIRLSGPQDAQSHDRGQSFLKEILGEAGLTAIFEPAGLISYFSEHPSNVFRL